MVLLLARTNHRLTLDLWFAKDNRFLNPKSSYKRILMAPPCRLTCYVRAFAAFAQLIRLLAHFSLHTLYNVSRAFTRTVNE